MLYMNVLSREMEEREKRNYTGVWAQCKLSSIHGYKALLVPISHILHVIINIYLKSIKTQISKVNVTVWTIAVSTWFVVGALKKQILSKLRPL